MLQTLAHGALFYRVTGEGHSWPVVLSGAGAYFSAGGRYNRVHQKTVYAAENPLVSIAEYAFHQAVRLQEMIGGSSSVASPVPTPVLPFVSDHLLWCFTLHKPPQVIDSEDPLALHTFRHRPYELLNPSSNEYDGTRMLADLMRHYPDPRHPAAGGILAPSVRTPACPGYTPRQPIFFVPHDVLAIPGSQVRRWKLTIEFADTADKSVTAQTRDIDWTRPWFRLSGARTPVPAYALRPKARPFRPGMWYQIGINFA